jgi:hypothetical protein
MSIIVTAALQRQYLRTEVTFWIRLVSQPNYLIPIVLLTSLLHTIVHLNSEHEVQQNYYFTRADLSHRSDPDAPNHTILLFFAVSILKCRYTFKHAMAVLNCAIVLSITDS